MSRHGPLPSTEFKVELDGVDVPGFLEVKLPEKKTQKHNYREGNDAKHARKMFGDTEYSPLELARGATKDNKRLKKWHTAVEEGKVDEARKDIAIVLMDEAGESVRRWEFRNAWVEQYTPPQLNAQSKGGAESMAVERYVIEFEEMEVKNL